MVRKLSVTIVGPGSLGGALAVSLHDAGYPVKEVVYRSDRKRAQAIARRAFARAIRFDKATFNAGVVWICVGDAEIRKTAEAMALRTEWNGKYVFHSSGALASDELQSLKRRGASVASLHPMMSFVRTAEASFDGVTFALEGDAPAKRIAAEVANALGGTHFDLKRKDKALYHALGAFSSPLLIAHLSAAEKIGKKLGLKVENTRQIIAPILQRTLRNYLEHGPAAALSGPMKRGDLETIRRNRAALKRVAGADEIYCALARMAVRELPVKQKARILRQLSS